MRDGRTLGLIATLLGTLGLGVAVKGDGTPQTPPGPYKADWGPQYDRATNRVARLSRRGRTVEISVNDGTCVTEEARAHDSIRKRLSHVVVRQRRDRVVIAVIMRPERHPAGGLCLGVGGGFDYRVHLDRPVGRRAVVADKVYEAGDTPIVYPALDAAVQHRLQRRYAGPPARDECATTPRGVLQMKYEGKSTDRLELARASAAFAPRAVRSTIYRACLQGFRDAR